MDSARRTQILELEQRRQSACLRERVDRAKSEADKKLVTLRAQHQAPGLRGQLRLEVQKYEVALREAAKEFVVIRSELGSNEPELLTETELSEWLANARKFFELWGSARSEHFIQRLRAAGEPVQVSGSKDSFFENAIAKAADVLADGFQELRLTASLGIGSAAGNNKVSGGSVLIAESRLEELRALKSSKFDFKKLIRLCEELNITSREECHLATAMLTRSLLDHVPPLFGQKSFKEVANNYGSRSFKDTMDHLESCARKVADAHLHTHIRNGETLPVAQQVNFPSHLDALLAEIVRIKP
jgi:hypothetical protein